MSSLVERVRNLQLQPSSSIEIPQEDIEKGFCSDISAYPTLNFYARACMEIAGLMNTEVASFEDRGFLVRELRSLFLLHDIKIHWHF